MSLLPFDIISVLSLLEHEFDDLLSLLLHKKASQIFFEQ
jgi:hypothetical protein